MSGSSSSGPKGKSRKGEVQLGSLVGLLEEQDKAMRVLFAKALNLYVSPGADETSDSEKLDRLKKAIEESLG